MQRAAALVLLVMIAGAGCLRVGPGEDLHLVCEEKSGSPRKAYGIEFLVAQTQVDEAVPQELRVPLLEAARQHIITMRGVEHAGFEARLAPAGEGWRFEATGAWADAPPDAYVVDLRPENDSVVGPAQIEAPRSIRDLAWASANASGEVQAAFPAGAAQPTSARWDPELPSCVLLRLQGAGQAREAVVNVAQSRVVALDK